MQRLQVFFFVVFAFVFIFALSAHNQKLSAGELKQNLASI